MASTVDRSVLKAMLESIEDGRNSTVPVRAWARTVIIGREVELDEVDATLITDVAYLLDEAPEGEIRDRARYLRQLIETKLPVKRIMAVLPLVREHRDICRIFGLWSAGRLSRTQFLSYVAERTWASDIKAAITAFSGPAITTLVQHLKDGDYERVVGLLDGRY